MKTVMGKWLQCERDGQSKRAAACINKYILNQYYHHQTTHGWKNWWNFSVAWENWHQNDRYKCLEQAAMTRNRSKYKTFTLNDGDCDRISRQICKKQEIMINSWELCYRMHTPENQIKINPLRTLSERWRKNCVLVFLSLNFFLLGFATKQRIRSLELYIELSL